MYLDIELSLSEENAQRDKFVSLVSGCEVSFPMISELNVEATPLQFYQKLRHLCDTGILFVVEICGTCSPEREIGSRNFGESWSVIIKDPIQPEICQNKNKALVSRISTLF